MKLWALEKSDQEQEQLEQHFPETFDNWSTGVAFEI